MSEMSFAVLVCRAGTKYTVNVSGVFDGGESMPLAGEEHTTLSDEPDDPLYYPGIENSILPFYHLHPIRVLYIFLKKQVSKHDSFFSKSFHYFCPPPSEQCLLGSAHQTLAAGPHR